MRSAAEREARGNVRTQTDCYLWREARGAKLRVDIRTDLGVEIVAPPVGQPDTDTGRFGRQDFKIDFEAS